MTDNGPDQTPRERPERLIEAGRLRPLVPFYTSDFLAGTSGMTAASRGGYITLLCLMCEAEAAARKALRENDE